MIRVSRKMWDQISPQSTLTIPEEQSFNLPEKVLQFGTGVLLRALPDYFIDQANKQGIFNGRIVVVKSTTHGTTKSFDEQNNLYTLCVRGIQNGNEIDQYFLNNSISRVLNVHGQWNEILRCAENESLQIIISNTTEAGIALTEDDIHANPPVSYPGKLLAFLFARYQFFKGDENKGMVIIPTELLVDNGRKLKDVLVSLAEKNKLGHPFQHWLTESNIFCNSLVDRIVPGMPPDDEREKIEERLGYKDDLMIETEPYCFWAIETSSERTKEILSFSRISKEIIISKDISKYRELKLRLLNGTHTFSCGLAFLNGIDTVREAMGDHRMKQFMHDLMMKEIIPVIISENISEAEAKKFAEETMDRFRNPFMDHHWYSITTEYTSKMRMREIPILLSYYEHFHQPPVWMSKGFAAYIRFMRSEKTSDGLFLGRLGGKTYKVQDSLAGLLYKHWHKNPDNPVYAILSDLSLWGCDLSTLPGLEREIGKNLTESVISKV